jgi:ferredoxin
MALKDYRIQENVPGKYYVDNQCIDCDMCREAVPEVFARSQEKNQSYVFKQPSTPEEEAKCQEALADCPLEAIGDDGI